jgi:adenosylcobinamide-GDP ribazoletransferase
LRIAGLTEPALASLSLLTAIPVPGRHGVPRITALFPVAGLMIGSLLVAVDAIAGLVLPVEGASAVVVVALAAITGGLHLDGLADTVDALGVRDPSRGLEVMRDPHNGAFGFTAIASVLLLKWAGLVTLDGELRMIALILTPALSRWVLIPVTAIFPASHPGMASIAHPQSAVPHILFGTALALASSIVLLEMRGLVPVTASVTFALALATLASAYFRGISGDILGAIVETAEAALLLLFSSGEAHGWLV